MQQIKSGVHHRHGDEVARFARVEPLRQGLVARLVIHQIGKIVAVQPIDPVFLHRNAPVEAFAEVRQPAAVGSHQPFVRPADQRIHAQFLHVEGQRAHRLRPVDNEQRADLPRPRANGFEIIERSVRPVNVRNGDQRGVHVDGIKQAVVPVGTARGERVAVAYGADFGVALASDAFPGVVVARKLLVDDDDVLPALQVEVARHHRHTVRHRRHQRDAVRIRAVDEPREGSAQVADGLEETFDGEPVGAFLLQHARHPCFDDGSRQGRHIGAVQIRDVGFEIEAVGLRLEHGDRGMVLQKIRGR